MFKCLSVIRIHLFLLYLPILLCSRQVDTFYGPIEVEEPVVLELIDSPSFQRLKHIHQYGVSYYTTHTEEYNRYDHSISVFAILRANGASLEERIAGLLHDVSHTAFSHVGDWVFGKENYEKDYQNNIHASFLEKSGLGAILRKHCFSIEQVLPNEELFPALENRLPNLCADRIDYNIQGAYYQGFITYDEALLIAQDVRYIDNKWVSTYPELMKKLTRFSLFMTQDCWGSPANYITSRWLADALLRGIEIGCLTFEDLHFGTDQAIWETLLHHSDPVIAEKMRMILQADAHFSVVDHDEGDFIIRSKFRGIDPWVVSGTTLTRITSLDPHLAEEYESAKGIVSKGWPIKMHSRH